MPHMYTEKCGIFTCGLILLRKLLHLQPQTRLTVLQDVKQWRNIAFCLSQLSIGDKGFHKLADMFPAYKDSLGDPQVYSCFLVPPRYRASAAAVCLNKRQKLHTCTWLLRTCTLVVTYLHLVDCRSVNKLAPAFCRRTVFV